MNFKFVWKNHIKTQLHQSINQEMYHYIEGLFTDPNPFMIEYQTLSSHRKISQYLPYVLAAWERIALPMTFIVSDAYNRWYCQWMIDTSNWGIEHSFGNKWHSLWGNATRKFDDPSCEKWQTSVRIINKLKNLKIFVQIEQYPNLGCKQLSSWVSQSTLTHGHTRFPKWARWKCDTHLQKWARCYCAFSQSYT